MFTYICSAETQLNQSEHSLEVACCSVTYDMNCTSRQSIYYEESAAQKRLEWIELNSQSQHHAVEAHSPIHHLLVWHLIGRSGTLKSIVGDEDIDQKEE